MHTVTETIGSHAGTHSFFDTSEATCNYTLHWVCVRTYMNPLGTHCRIAKLLQQNAKTDECTITEPVGAHARTHCFFDTSEAECYCTLPWVCQNPHEPTRHPSQNRQVALTKCQS